MDILWFTNEIKADDDGYFICPYIFVLPFISLFTC